MTIVATPAHPATWDANFVMAGPGVGAAAVFAALETFDRWQVVEVDVLTDPEVEAALALAGFAAASTLIEMVAKEVAAPLPVPAVTSVPVDASNFATLAALIEVEQGEGRQDGRADPAVTAGLIAARRGRMEACDYWLIHAGGDALGYGMTAVCPNGLGLIENLFTLRAHRGRGLMSGFIVEAARRLQAEECDGLFLDAHANDTPKHLYARLGFRPVALTRTWTRRP